jgi:3'(2'), 5'-bisphosphate nucleotidase
MTAARIATQVGPELEEVIRIARLAAERVSAIRAEGVTVEFKAPGDPVTRADRESSDIICTSLARSFPHDAILSEEAVPSSPVEVSRLVSSPRVWFVDPLDGTREFSEGLPEFAVMIGLAVGGRAQLGALAMPALGLTLAARVGASAFVAEDARRGLTVSNVSEPSEATLYVSRSHRPSLVDSVIERLGIKRVVASGSVGVKIARLVLGQGDVYVHDGGGAKLWDTCGPEAVLTAAGGRFSDLYGAPIDYASVDLVLRRGIVATNGALHDVVLSACRRTNT